MGGHGLCDCVAPQKLPAYNEVIRIGWIVEEEKEEKEEEEKRGVGGKRTGGDRFSDTRQDIMFNIQQSRGERA